MILADEDISSAIQMHLQEKGKDGYICAQDIIDYISTPEMQRKLEKANIKKKSILLCTAQRWLRFFGWHYGKIKKGMYIDGHECEDVVKY